MIYLFGYFFKLIELSFRSFLVKLFWLWFIVPHFMVAPLSLGTAFGVVFLVSIFHEINFKKSDFVEIDSYSKEELVRFEVMNFMMNLFSCLFVFLFAAIIIWMM